MGVGLNTPSRCMAAHKTIDKFVIMVISVVLMSFMVQNPRSWIFCCCFLLFHTTFILHWLCFQVGHNFCFQSSGWCCWVSWYTTQDRPWTVIYFLKLSAKWSVLHEGAKEQIQVAFPRESQLQQSCATQPMVHAGCFNVSIIHQTLTWTTEYLSCAQK